MDGQKLYGIFESTSTAVQAPWEHLTNEEQQRWNDLALEVALELGYFYEED